MRLHPKVKMIPQSNNVIHKCLNPCADNIIDYFSIHIITWRDSFPDLFEYEEEDDDYRSKTFGQTRWKRWAIKYKPRIYLH